MPARVAESGADWTLPPENPTRRWRALRGPHEIRAGLRLHGDPERGVARYDNGRRAADISPNDRPDLPIRGFQVQLSAGRQDQARVLVPTEDAAHTVAQEYVGGGRIPEGSATAERRPRAGEAARREIQWRRLIADAMRARHLPQRHGRGGNRFSYEDRDAEIVQREPTPQGPSPYVVFCSHAHHDPSTEPAGSYPDAERIAREYVANGRRPGSRDGRDLLPEGIHVHAGVDRLNFESSGRSAVLTQRHQGDEYATEITLVDVASERTEAEWAGTRPHFTQGLDVATDYLDTGRVPTEPSRPNPRFPMRHDLPQLPRNLQMDRVGTLWSSYVPTGGTIETAPRAALVQWAGTRKAPKSTRYRVTALKEGRERSRYSAPTYRDAHRQAREYVRTGKIPAPPSGRERLPIPEPGARRVGRSGPGKGADHAGPSR